MPSRNPEVRNNHEAQTEGPSVVKLRILIVEDEAAQLEGITRMLKAKGLLPTGAATAEEACRFLEEGQFDAILTDNVLPGMTGLQALPEFKKRSNAPIVMMTSHPSVDLELDAVLLGAKAVLTKPLDLEQTLREFLSFAEVS